MEFSALRPGVWLTVVEPESVTVGLVAGTEASLLIDAGTSPEQGRELRATAARVTDKPLRHVVVTHGHWDHVDGLAAFADVETIGHESLAAPLPLTTTLADIGFRDLGDQPLEIAHFGPAHTQSDLIVALPGAQVVFAGDLIETSGPPQFDDSTSIEGWVKTLDAMYALLKPRMLVVPGHGPVVDGGEVGRQRAGLTMLWGQAEWAFLQGLPEPEVYSHEGMSWLWDEATTRQGIALAYRELRAKPEPAPDRTGPTFR